MDVATPFQFRLAASGRAGVFCDAEGAFVGSTPLLVRRSDTEGGEWHARDIVKLNDELSSTYGLPIDFTTKASGLATIARALNDDKMALAQIATLNLRLPDPPDLKKGIQSTENALKLIVLLYWTGILKGDWDPDEHPRVGGPPNAGWFASKPKEPKQPKPGWPTPTVNQELRKLLRGGASVAARRGLPLLFGPAGFAREFLDAFLNQFDPADLNQGEERVTQQYLASLDPPKTLDELQMEPQENQLGYEQHHIVEQNPDNIAKHVMEKFGRDLIDDPDNIVWIPRLRHEDVTAYYNSSTDEIGSDGQILRQRDVVNLLDYGQQREVGLRVLRDNGVLK